MGRDKFNFKASKKSRYILDDMDYELDNNWQKKADAFELRRWRALKREIKGKHYGHH